LVTICTDLTGGQSKPSDQHPHGAPFCPSLAHGLCTRGCSGGAFGVDHLGLLDLAYGAECLELH
ncbi:MAG: hypothetical protein AAFZ14_01765, partial [Pseudomonadota bacterium]